MVQSGSVADAVRMATLLEGSAYVPPGCDVEVTGLATDSRAARPGDLFFACPGSRLDGRRFVPAALRAGAVAAVVGGEPGVARYRTGAPLISVPDVRAALGVAADCYHGAPSSRLRVVGVTGTNGKTSVTHFAAQALAALPGETHRPGLLGTLGYGPLGHLTDGDLTTPDAAAVHGWLARLETAGCAEVLMEVSSHALDQRRVAGVRFTTAVFTNLTRDHLDYHGDMHAYGRAKRRLFDRNRAGWAIINVSDPYGQGLVRHAAGGPRIIGYALGTPGEALSDGAGAHEPLTATLRLDRPGFMHLDVDGAFGAGEITAPLVGTFNACNLLAALGILLSLDVPFDSACAALGEVAPLPGRMQQFGGGDAEPLVVVDYSHTPDALGSALGALRTQAPGHLWCVFGCGGDRDRGKRALMGEVAVRLADRVVITDDNPRHEDGDAIVREILAGAGDASTFVVERDRAAAIAIAIADAGAGDVVLVAGKGHETHQDIAGERRPFSDAAAVRRALEDR